MTEAWEIHACVQHSQDVFQDGSKHELTTFSSGTDRLSVHSWLFTKASVEEENIHNVRIMTFNALLRITSHHGFGKARPKATPELGRLTAQHDTDQGCGETIQKNPRNSHSARICSQQPSAPTPSAKLKLTPGPWGRAKALLQCVPG